MNRIAPSILSADFGNLARDIQMLNESDAAALHLDVMDGTFVPNISFGFPVIKSIASVAKKPLDAHLMIVHPEKYVKRCHEHGADMVSVHYEACEELRATLSLIRSFGMKAGLVINPETDADVVRDYLFDCDFILVMSVHPGFGGQSFIEGSVEKVSRIKHLIDEAGAECFIEIDGGVGASNIAELAKAGASLFVAGSAVFKASDPVAEIARLGAL